MTEISIVYLTMICVNIMFIVFFFKLFRGKEILDKKNDSQQRQIDELKRELEEMKRK